MSAKETDIEDKVDPTVIYLQKLGPEYVNLVFEGSRWVIALDKEKGLQVSQVRHAGQLLISVKIFTSEEHELPREEVADFLEEVDPHMSIRYVEYLINERKETGVEFHDRLAELYLQDVLKTSGHGDAANAKFLSFLESSSHYRAVRIMGLLPREGTYQLVAIPFSLLCTGMLEARAILLGRMGENKAALSIYAYKLKNFAKAEE
jgi:Vam6/Vps39-like protein vacuolar protein sorting-associated protein 39